MQDSQIRIGHSACPHDCPSTCALDVELLGNNKIGRVHGAKDNTYTDGIICAKVARYAERVGAEPARWLFLTGTDSEVQRFVREGLLLPYAQETGADVAPGERVTHGLMAIVYGAVLACLLPEIGRWIAEPTALTVSPVDAPPLLGGILGLMAVGVAVSGVRDLLASFGVKLP